MNTTIHSSILYEYLCKMNGFKHVDEIKADIKKMMLKYHLKVLDV
jgi:hypothetical protein